MDKRTYEIGDRFYYDNGDYWELRADDCWHPHTIRPDSFWRQFDARVESNTLAFRGTLESYEKDSERVPNHFTFKAKSGAFIREVRRLWTTA